MTSHRATYAMQAWEHGRRRRTVTGAVERLADGLMAAGGILLANAVLPINMGLPEGRIGALLGATLLSAGLAWISRHRANAMRPHRPVASRMPVPVPANMVQMVRPVELRRAA